MNSLESKLVRAWSQDCDDATLLEQLDREIAQVEQMWESSQSCSRLDWPEALLCYLNGLLETAQELQEVGRCDALPPQVALDCLREADALMEGLLNQTEDRDIAYAYYA